VGEDGLYREGILHGSDDSQPAATAGAGEDIEVEHAAHQCGPRPRARGAGAAGASVDVVRVQVECGASVADDLPAPASPRGEEAVIHKQVDRGPGNDGGELLQEFDGLEEEVGRSIAPHRLEFDEDAPVGAEADAVLGKRGAEEIATELLAPGGRDRWGGPDVGVEVEAVELGRARAAGGDVTEVRLVAQAADTSASAGAEGDAALEDEGPPRPGARTGRPEAPLR
jgi:hypothetical protein